MSNYMSILYPLEVEGSESTSKTLSTSKQRRVLSGIANVWLFKWINLSPEAPVKSILFYGN